MNLDQILYPGVAAPARQVDGPQLGTVLDVTDDGVVFMLDAYGSEHRFGPAPYNRSLLTPDVGARCLVLFAGRGVGQPWVAAWWGEGVAPGSYDRSLALLLPPSYVYAGTWGTAYDPVHGGAFITNTSTAGGDSAGFDIEILPGTWTFGALLGTGTNNGITKLDISYDSGTTWATVGTKDCNGTDGATFAEFTGVTVPIGTTVATVRVTVQTLTVTQLAGLAWRKTT